jgi:PIN domain nuclease of toxin-antitoxin system
VLSRPKLRDQWVFGTNPYRHPHTALWYLFGDSRLTAPAKQFIDNAATERHTIALAPISLAEVVFLVEKNRLPPSAYNDLRSALANPNHVLEEAPFTADVVEAMRQVARDSVPDMPHRIVAATAVYLRVPVISRDGRIRASMVKTVW